jgi:putative oxygen-independent coproporphyrinogen III oxidase
MRSGNWSMPVSENPGSDPFGVYVHWPFCAAKCPYCDFNSHVRHKPVDQRQFADALCTEIATTARRVPGRQVESVFFGGGTPSLMEPGTVARILDCIAGNWAITDDAEITLEANPTSVEAERFRGYSKAGVNRLSLGVQALEDSALQALGRLHNVDQALGALAIANETFARVSIDLIYARPGQALAQWEDELARALALGVGHISPYQLTIEAGTPFADLEARGKLRQLPTDLAFEMFDATNRICNNAGLPAYEISNHARPGDESRHNLIYWRYGEYAGIGPGAHGRLVVENSRWSTATELHPETWRKKIEDHGSGLVTDDRLSPDEASEEYLLMALRLSEGLDLARYERIAGAPLAPFRYQSLIEEGFLGVTGTGKLSATDRGRPVLNSVIAILAGP